MLPVAVTLRSRLLAVSKCTGLTRRYASLIFPHHRRLPSYESILPEVKDCTAISVSLSPGNPNYYYGWLRGPQLRWHFYNHCILSVAVKKKSGGIAEGLMWGTALWNHTKCALAAKQVDGSLFKPKPRSWGQVLGNFWTKASAKLILGVHWSNLDSLWTYVTKNLRLITLLCLDMIYKYKLCSWITVCSYSYG